MRTFITMALCLYFGAASATPITYNFSGEITAVRDTDVVQIGDRYYGWASFDPSTQRIDYRVELFDIWMEPWDDIGQYTHTFLDTNSFVLMAMAVGKGGGFGDYWSEEFNLRFFGDLGLTGPFEDLSMFHSGYFGARWGAVGIPEGAFFGGAIDTFTVPEPGTLGLFGLGLLGLVISRRKRPLR